MSASQTRRMLRGVVNKLVQADRDGDFRDPVQKNDAPDYYSVVARPMDLRAIEVRAFVLVGFYLNKGFFGWWGEEENMSWF